MIYDDLYRDTYYESVARIDDGFMLGIYMQNDNYACRTYGTDPYYNEAATSVTKSEGWHKLKFDFSDGQTCKLYIDDEHITTVNKASWRKMLVGGPDSHRTDNNTYFDDWKVMVPADPELTAAVAEATALRAAATVGNGQGQWMQDSVDTFDAAIASAEAVLNTVNAEQTAVDAAIVALEAAVAKFEDSQNEGRVIFYQGFEPEEGLSNVTAGNANGITLSTEQAYSGNSSFKQDGAGDHALLTYDTPQVGTIITVMIYDDLYRDTYYESVARIDDGFMLGIYMQNDNYACRTYGTDPYYNEAATSVTKSEGWHKLKFDFSDGQTCKLYIDDEHITTVNKASWRKMLVGGPDSHRTDNNTYFDDWKVMVPETEG